MTINELMTSCGWILAGHGKKFTRWEAGVFILVIQMDGPVRRGHYCIQNPTGGDPIVLSSFEGVDELMGFLAVLSPEQPSA